MSMEAAKRNAGRKALEFVQPGMVVGLGTGSTVRHFVEGLGEMVRGGLEVRGIPSSHDTELLARSVGIRLQDLEAPHSVDLCVDGADEVDPGFHLVKGGGGALLREKILASESKNLVVVIDESKLVERLGLRSRLPIEVVPFALGACKGRIEALGAKVEIRKWEDRHFITDNGNYILDADFGEQMAKEHIIRDPGILEQSINAVRGVVDNGLFVGMAETLIVGTEDGAEIRTRT